METFKESAAMIQTVENIALAALASIETCRSTYAIARQAIEEKIPGDFVECGVYAGSQAAIMARAMWDVAGQRWPWPTQRHIHLFDSFEGCPEPGPKDVEFRESGHKAGQASCTLEGVKSNMAQWGIPEELMVYHPGWFADTIPPPSAPGITRNQIAALRLDADLYESTLLCLEYLYPLLSAGGFLIVDDYALSGARQAVEDYFDRRGGRGPIYLRKQP